MSDGAHFEPEPFQIVSDLGQLNVFSDALKVRILRVFQHQACTPRQVATMIGESASTVSEHVENLKSLGLLRVVGERKGKNDLVYRATARVYSLRPEPAENGPILASVAAATMDSVKNELVTSLHTWPKQRLNYEGRRTRMSPARAMEFNERLLELVSEYWGSGDEPIEGDPDDPLMAFVGFWYRYPEDE